MLYKALKIIFGTMILFAFLLALGSTIPDYDDVGAIPNCKDPKVNCADWIKDLKDRGIAK
jgi:hypothetical protein